MCGIAGICSMGDPNPVSPEQVKRMIRVLCHRGPDQAGIYVDDRVGLGQVRLSVIDPAGGNQPIPNETESCWIVYNGEVFNYPDLRAGLAAGGHRFRTATDTEVVLHHFEEKGPACVEDFNGQFAFAVWNAFSGELFLARDRLGLKPLFYTVRDGRLLFASEIKALLAVLPESPVIDPIAMDQIFTFWTTAPGRTAFRGIHELPPAHYLRLAGGRIEIRRYWQMPFCAPEDQLHEPVEPIADRVRELLLDAVRIRLRADVPVGGYLSGGLDSTGIAATIRRHFDNRLQTFGIAFEDGRFDETGYQHEAVTFLQTRHTEERVRNEQIGAAFSEVIRHAETPLLRTAPVPLYLLSRRVRESGFKVVLTGEGGDEVFGGYNIFREAKVRRFWARQRGSAWRPRLLARLYPYVFRDAKSRAMIPSFFGRGLDAPDAPFFSHRIRWENTGRLRRLFSDDLGAATRSYDRYGDLLQSLPAGYGQWDYLARAQYLEVILFLGGYLLSSQGDRVAMAHSVEARMPYLDHRLVELAARMPARWKIRGLTEKYVLKKAFEGVVPDRIRERSKHPFRAPIRDALLKGEAAAASLDMLSAAALKNAGLFDAAKVPRLVERMRRAEAPGELDDMALAGILSAQWVHRHFVEDFRSWSAAGTGRLPPCPVVDRRTGPLRGRGKR